MELLIFNNMIKRALASKLKETAAKMPILSITGPRQSGKTTLARATFPDYDYVNLERPDERAFAREDPNGFLERFQKGVILDEAQHVPELFSYIQAIADERQTMGQFILSGSQNFLLLEKITQSLAGRVAIYHLLPFSIKELRGSGAEAKEYEELLWQGFYPPIYDRALAPDEFYPWYLQTYVERDVRQVLNIKDLSTFELFLGLCAGRLGQTINYNSLANDTGVNVRTVKNWLSVLEASFVIHFLKPHHRNFKKRLVKSPKLYFYDAGLASYLLGITNADQIKTHHLKGALFENLVVSDILKNFHNQGASPRLSFWRDNSNHEVDLLIENGDHVKAIEIKAGKTIHSSFFEGLHYYGEISTENVEPYLVYGGKEVQQRKQGKVLGWNRLLF